MKFITFLSIIFVLSLNTIAQETGSFYDSRDGKTYKTVKIDNQTWFAENLNYIPSRSCCYEDNLSNCTTYGGLYNWQAAKIACPTGWHLPTKGEFLSLLFKLGGGSNAYNALIKGGSSGFSALFGGWRANGSFGFIGKGGGWWSSSEDDFYNAWKLKIGGYTQDAKVVSLEKDWDNSVRCLKNQN